MSKKLFLLDAYALIFRSYYAFISNPMKNSAGIPTSTVFGFTLVLEELLKKENPDYIGVVFDPPGPNFRHEMYEAYKANRDATPEDIKTAVPYIKELLEGFRIPVIEVAGYEADDVIGTLAKQAEKEGFDVYMMTPDKDFAQLVSDHIFMYKPGKRGADPEVLGVSEVQEKFGIKDPLQVIDILALMGDSADNIPGARGVGPKTAEKLIAAYGSVEQVYEHLDELKGKQRENLENSREDVLLSKVLATIALDVPSSFDSNACLRKNLDQERLEKLFLELQFSTLSRRILGSAGVTQESSGTEKHALAKSNSGDGQGSLFDTAEEVESVYEKEWRSAENVSHDYSLVREEADLKELAKELQALETFCFDTETTGLDPIEAELVGIAFSWEAHKAAYVPVGENREEAMRVLKLLRPVFENEKIKKIGQNLKYDLHILSNYDIEVKGKLFDTMLAHFLLKPEQRHNLNNLAETYLDYQMIKIETLIGSRGAQQSSFRSIPSEIACEYAGEDADITWQLALILNKELKTEGLEELAEKIEMPLVPVLMEMEHQGVRLDVNALDRFAGELREDILRLEQQIYMEAGMEFNISSPKQLGEVLFRHLKIIEKPRLTKSKQFATGEEVLIGLRDKHSIVELVLEYRSLKKLLGTYVEALPKLIKPSTGKIHTSYNQALVTTGRLSSTNPNLQNIPIREERGREIRKAFITEKEGEIFLSADYSQIELRLMAHMSNDKHMIDAFVRDEDIHRSTAARVFKVSPEEVSRDMRSQAKTANFGIIYGISAFGLSQRMHISRKEAKELIDGYFESYPGVREFMDRSISFARENGYVETMFGRRRQLPDILSRNSTVRGNAERNAINSPLQGSAADIIKIAMLRIRNAMKERKMQSSMVLQVHDELNFNVLSEELKELQEIVKQEMEQAVHLAVPLTIDMGTGSNWLEAH